MFPQSTHMRTQPGQNLDLIVTHQHVILAVLNFWHIEPWATERVLLDATMFVLICYARTENYDKC